MFKCQSRIVTEGVMGSYFSDKTQLAKQETINTGSSPSPVTQCHDGIVEVSQVQIARQQVVIN